MLDRIPRFKDTLQAKEGGIDKGELLIADFIFHSMSVFGIFTQLEATFFKWPMHIDNNYA